MDFGIYAADTDKTIYVRLRDSTTGLAKTGLAYNSSGVVFSYTLPLAARAAITPATQTVTGAHSDGGFVEIDATNAKGLYRLDLPDAAIASGAFTVVSVQFTGVISESVLIPLHTRKVNVTQWLGTAAATPTVAGVPEVDVTHWLGTAPATPTTAGVPKVDVADWGGSNATLQKSMIGGLPQVDALTLKDEAPDTLVFGEVRDNLDIETTTATGSPTSTTVRLTAGSTQDDFYKDQLIYISTGTGIGQARPILGYVGSTKEVTVDEPFVVTPASGDGISIRIAHVHPISQIADAVCDESLSGHSTSGTVGKAISDIVADTNELQTNQGNWLTATGFSTHSAADAASAVWTVGNMATAAMKRVADFVLRRNTANAAASTETGLDTLSFRSPIGAVRKLTNHINTTATAGKLTIMEEDDATPAATQTLATDASAEPITGANTD